MEVVAFEGPVRGKKCVLVVEECNFTNRFFYNFGNVGNRVS